MPILIGIALALLFLLNVVIKTLLKRERVGFIDLLLALASAVALVLAMTNNHLQPAADPQIDQLVLIAGASMAIVGLIMIIIERVRGLRQFGSRGMLGVGTGILIALASFSVPFTATALTVPTPTPIQIAQVGASIQTSTAATVRPSATARPTTTPMPTSTPVPSGTPTPRPTATPTATRWSFATMTPLPTATLVTPCFANVEFNLRLRTEPSTESETLLVIPFDNTILLYGRNEESTWWYAEYDGQTGWVDGEFITRSNDCDVLPVRG